LKGGTNRKPYHTQTLGKNFGSTSSVLAALDYLKLPKGIVIALS
jgi:hypothetical protein